jgi:uroporphyrinogen III methyltransferase / synthase
MSADKPLEGKCVVITRAAEQSSELKQRLENLGAKVLLLPAVSFFGPSDTIHLDRVIAALETFDWVFFTSANAARFFDDRCRKVARDVRAGKMPRYAAVGPATASVAAKAGFTVDYVAQEFQGVALARELGASLAGKRVLLPRSDRAGSDLPTALKHVGAEVTEAVVYHTGGIGPCEPGVLEAVRDARVDVVSFFSPSAVENLRTELGAEVVSRLGTRAAFAAVGPVTAAALRKAGLPVAIEASEATAGSVAAAIAKHFLSPGVSQARSL